MHSQDSNQGPRPYVLAETNWKAVKDTDFQVAVLPWGATEAHNYHMPYATDNIQVEAIAVEAAGIAWEAGAKVIVLPTVPFGVNTGQLDVKLCINMNPSTQYAILHDICDVLSRQGIDKLVVFNGHGGNHFKQMIRELYVHYPDIFICSILGYFSVDLNEYFDEPGDHAGEMETSLVMHLKPHLVLPLEEAGDGADKKFKIEAFKEGWASAPRKWTDVTKDTGVGNPAKSSAEKGRVYFQAVCKKVGDFFTEVANTDNDDLYE